MHRLNVDGTPDVAFGTKPFAEAPSYDRRILVQSDRKILIVQDAYGAMNGLQRLNADGSPDRTFAGADLSPEVIARNRRRFPGVRFHVLNLEEEPLDEQFDLVTCSEVVEHLNDQERGLRHLAAMTKPRGHVLVTCPTGTVYPTERSFGHVAHPSQADVERYARASGLDVVAALNWGWPFYKAVKWATNVNSRWALEHFASGRYTALAKLSSHAVYYANFANLSSARGCQLFVLMQKR